MTKPIDYVQAIKTTFYGATTTKNSRVKALAKAGYIWHSWDPALSIPQNHARAAETLANKFGWAGRYYAGGLDDNSMVFVSAGKLNAEFDIAFATEGSN